uniref:Uncharacterized protein n=1 Tax=biofilter metagenome TaxID=1070537 RepID=A0A1A7GEE4_9ZZZZ
MNYYADIETGAVTTLEELRAAHPDTIYPIPLTVNEGYAPLEETLPEHDPATQRLSYSPTATETGGIWSRTITVIDLTPAELAAAKKARVPQVVTRRQARRALAIAGLLDLVQPAIDAIADPTQRALAQIDWDDATDFRRDDATLLMLSAALGLSEEQLDDLFILAGEQP